METQSEVMIIDDTKDIIKQMSNEFDAHDFIFAYIKYCTHKYFAMLGRNNYNVNLTNAQISHFISRNLEELRLEVLGEVVSLNFMSNLSTCMSWKKI